MWSKSDEIWIEPGVVAVVGLGKIGLPLAVQYALRGWRVLGCDHNPQVVSSINSGHPHIHEESELVTIVPGLVEQGLLSATGAISEAVSQAQVVIVIVPVIIDERHEPQFQQLDAATKMVGLGLKPGTLVNYETTLPVGTTAGRLRSLLEQYTHLRAGQDFYLAYSPERVSSGHIFRDLRIYPKIVGGIDEESTRVACAFYRSALEAEVISMASASEAEFVKLIETTYRDVNIALANEFACYADERGLNAIAAIEAANTQPYSHVHLPGVGVGGHCIPVYPYFLLHDARPVKSASMAQGLNLLREARRVNDAMAEYAVRCLESAIGSLWQRAVLLLGVAYRGDVRETSFSSAYLIQDALRERGAVVYADDPLYGPDELRALGFEPLRAGGEDEIEAMIAQAIHRAYEDFDLRRFGRCKALLDGRRGFGRVRVEDAGMRYLTPGDGLGGREIRKPVLSPSGAREGYN